MQCITDQSWNQLCVITWAYHHSPISDMTSMSSSISNVSISFISVLVIHVLIHLIFFYWICVTVSLCSCVSCCPGVCVCEYVCVCANMCLIWYVCLSDSFHLPQPNYWRVFRYEDYKRDDADDGMFLIIMTMSMMSWLADQKIDIFLTSVVGALCWLFWNFCLAMHSDVNPSVITLH